MITISGVREQDRVAVARAIVTALGVSGVCTAEIKCARAPASCREGCVIRNYFTFLEDESDVESKKL